MNGDHASLGRDATITAPSLNAPRFRPVSAPFPHRFGSVSVAFR